MHTRRCSPRVTAQRRIPSSPEMERTPRGPNAPSNYYGAVRLPPREAEPARSLIRGERPGSLVEGSSRPALLRCLGRRAAVPPLLRLSRLAPLHFLWGRSPGDAYIPRPRRAQDKIASRPAVHSALPGLSGPPFTPEPCKIGRRAHLAPTHVIEPVQRWARAGCRRRQREPRQSRAHDPCQPPHHRSRPTKTQTLHARAVPVAGPL